MNPLYISPNLIESHERGAFSGNDLNPGDAPYVQTRDMDGELSLGDEDEVVSESQVDVARNAKGLDLGPGALWSQRKVVILGYRR
jgi:hypothetical protein